ncbi:hypothetical protein D9619_009190 [Psilocybe cf. subviscida]|uniref:Uncharacterized protein n=1 Tax=Psilocybe cf. subviscida TaxID=2480587 RepID=A0A8H5BUP7_9AGAR|nr:hypothetical protein D9619_009190 [Psilocybe cf. subviscida]
MSPITGSASFLVLYMLSCIASVLAGRFPANQEFYSSAFVTPSPPKIQSEFRANYMQMYISPTHQMIRADGAGDNFLETSLFDFRNTTGNGTLVANSILSFVNGTTEPTCSSFFVAPFVQLFPEDFLAQSNAVFSGTQRDDIHGLVDTWTFSAQF